MRAYVVCELLAVGRDGNGSDLESSGDSLVGELREHERVALQQRRLQVVQLLDDRREGTCG